MRYIKLFESFINEGAEQKYTLDRIKDGVKKEELIGTVEQLRLRFSKALDDVAARYPKLHKENPDTIEELLAALNHAQQIKEKLDKPHTIYALVKIKD